MSWILSLRLIHAMHALTSKLCIYDYSDNAITKPSYQHPSIIPPALRNWILTRLHLLSGAKNVIKRHFLRWGRFVMRKNCSFVAALLRSSATLNLAEARLDRRHCWNTKIRNHDNSTLVQWSVHKCRSLQIIGEEWQRISERWEGTGKHVCRQSKVSCDLMPRLTILIC